MPWGETNEDTWTHEWHASQHRPTTHPSLGILWNLASPGKERVDLGACTTSSRCSSLPEASSLALHRFAFWLFRLFFAGRFCFCFAFSFNFLSSNRALGYHFVSCSPVAVCFIIAVTNALESCLLCVCAMYDILDVDAFSYFRSLWPESLYYAS